MSSVVINCPFSGKVCTECAIYRGRHYYLCSAKRYFGCEWDISLHASIELPNNHGKEEETFQRLTDIPASPRMISDVEDLIETEEFSRFRLKGEKYDT